MAMKYPAASITAAGHWNAVFPTVALQVIEGARHESFEDLHMDELARFKGRRRARQGSQSTEGNVMNKYTRDNVAAFMAQEALDACSSLVYYRTIGGCECLVDLLERRVVGAADALIVRASL